MKKRILFSVLICILAVLSIGISVYAASQTKLLTVNVQFDGDVSVYVDGEYIADAPLSRYVSKDSTVTLVNGSDNFMFYSSADGSTFGYNGEYSFQMISKTSIDVWYENTNTEKVCVVYKNTNSTQQILASASYRLSDIDTYFAEHLAENANKFGYEFSSWNKSVSEIITAAKNGGGTVVVEPLFTEADTLFTVTVVGGYISSENENDGVFKMNSNVTLTANDPEEGKKFAYWTNKHGTVISDSETITLTVISDGQYTAHFVGENETVELEPTVTLSAAYDKDVGKVVTFAQRFVPNSYTIKAYGLIYAKDVTFAQEDMTVDAVDGVDLKMSYNGDPQTPNGNWINRISCENYVCVRAYIMYTDADGESYTIYSNAIKATISEESSVVVDINFDNNSASGDGYSVFGTASVVDNSLALNSGYIVIPVEPQDYTCINVYTNITFTSLPSVMTDIFSINMGMTSDSVGDGISGSWEEGSNAESHSYNGKFLRVGADGYLYLYDASANTYNKTDIAIEENTTYKIYARYDLASGKVDLSVNDAFVASEECFSITADKFDLVIMDRETSFGVILDNVKLEKSLDGVCTKHSYVKTVTPETCGEQGYTTYTCVYCASSYTSDLVDPTEDHTYDDGVLANDGLSITYTCAVCGDTYSEEYIPYTVVYNSDITSETDAQELASSLSSKTGYVFNVAESSQYSGNKYINISNVTPLGEKYGWTVNESAINLYFGAFVPTDTLIDQFNNSISSINDLSEITSAEYSVDAYDSCETATRYTALTSTVNILDASFSDRVENVLTSENTDLSGITGTVYYISENGDDSNGGTSPDAAWKTLSKLASATLDSGDAVVFERGGLYRGTVKAVSGVTYGCYGEGNKPIICGSAQNYAGLWTKVEGNIWKLNVSGILDPGIMVFDAHLYDVDNYNENTGARVFDCYTMSSSDTADSTTLYGYKMLDKNYEFYYGTPDMTAANFNRDSTSYTLYLYYDGDLNADFDDIEIGEDKLLFNACGVDGVTVDGLCFKYTGGHCVRGGGQTQTTDLTVKNCVFAWSGGSILQSRWVRYGNAVEIYGSGIGINVYNNWIYEIYDTGFTMQYSGNTNKEDIVWKDIYFSNNLIERCYWGMEFWCTPYYTTDSETGEVISAKSMIASNINVTNNVITKISNSWGVYQHQNALSGAGAVFGSIEGCGAEVNNRPIKLADNIFDRTYIEGYSGQKLHEFTRMFKILYEGTDLSSYNKFYKFENNYIIQYSEELIALYNGGESGNAYYNAEYGNTYNSSDPHLWSDFYQNFSTDDMTGTKVCIVSK